MENKTIYVHFDVNKTIIVKDTSKNIDMRKTISSILADFSYGTVEYDNVNNINVFNFKYLSDFSNLNDENNTISYADFSTNILGNRKLKENFGYDKYSESCSQLVDDYINYLSEMQTYNILPAFFEFLNYVNNLKIQGYTVKILFRTFGQDANEILHELQDINNHPYMKKYNYVSPIIFESLKCLFLIRNNKNMIALSNKSRENIDCNLNFETEENFSYVLQNYFDNNNSLLIVDDYTFWSDKLLNGNLTKSFSGKPLILIPDTFQIFFDDNTELINSDNNIINPIGITERKNFGNLTTCDELKLNLLEIIKVTHEVISNKYFFIDKLNSFLQKY